MTNRKSIIFISLLSLAFYACGQNPYEISTENVTKLISELASDEMNGRRAFSEEIDMAADLLAGEFEEIGLSPLTGLDSYLQKFEVYSLTLAQSEFAIDGNILDPKDYMLSADRENVSISENSKVVYVTEEDNFRQKFGELSNSGEDMVVLVDPTHLEMFSRYKSFFSRPRRRTTLGDGGTQVFSLYSGEQPTEIRLDAQYDVKTEALQNVAGMIEGKRKDEFILFSAHYDHIGIQNPVEGDSIANGANDDASGTTAVVELAKYFKTRSMPERTLLFVAFTAEESGGYGSQHFSEQLNPDEIMAMFNIEMIGKPAVEGPNTAWITGFDKSNFGELLQKSAEGTIYSFYPDPYPTQNLFYRSDNATLARLGVPAHTISTTPIDVDEDYHKVSDEVSTLDLEHLTNTIKAIAAAAQGMVDGSQTPTRVDPLTID